MCFCSMIVFKEVYILILIYSEEIVYDDKYDLIKENSVAILFLTGPNFYLNRF